MVEAMELGVPIGNEQLTTMDLPFLTEAEEELAPGRERALCAPLVPVVDSLIESQYEGALPEDEDCVHVYRTAEQGARDTGGRLTRADLTVLVSLRLPSLGLWLDMHAVEVKPYWSIGRDGLYEAAAQAAMQRCSHSWLVAYIPGPHVSLAEASRSRAEPALALIKGPLSEEAEELILTPGTCARKSEIEIHNSQYRSGSHRFRESRRAP